LKAYLIESPVGLFLIDKTGKIVEKALFPRNPKDAAQVYGEIRKGVLPTGYEDFTSRVAGLEIERVTVDNQAAADLARKIGGLDKVELNESDPAINRYRSRLSGMLVRLQLIESKDDYEKLVRDVSLELAKTAIGEAATRRDLFAVQTVRTIEDLDKVLNLLAGRIREWYGLHFPELDRLVEKHDSYIRLVQNLGTRDNFTEQALIDQGIPADRSQRIAEAAQKSAGAELPESDLAWLKEVCTNVLQEYKLREKAEGYTDKVLAEVAPNMSAVIGPVLSAKIISIVGGLEGVAKLPASTLQVLGAEKALFRTIQTGARPPKHGIIFQFAPIHTSPRWLRGKIARAVAGKLAIAARMDAYGGENQGLKMRDALEAKINELKTRYPEPPARKPGQTRTYGPPRREGRGGRDDRRRFGGGGGRDRRGGRSGWSQGGGGGGSGGGPRRHDRRDRERRQMNQS
jgi:nucleolar protein 56